MSQRLADALRAEGGMLADLVDPAAQLPAGGPARLAASGPRANGRESDYELLLEMIIEGSRLHYGASRVVRTDDQDLALLLGDQLYALGLARLASLGDMDAVRVLAETIASLAQAHAEGQPERGEEIWEAAAIRIGWGAESAGPDRDRRVRGS
jgi:hypothetical protein